MMSDPQLQDITETALREVQAMQDRSNLSRQERLAQQGKWVLVLTEKLYRQVRLATLEEVRAKLLQEQEEIIQTWEDDPTVPAHAHEPKVCNDRCDGYCIAINTMSSTLSWLDQQIAEAKKVDHETK